MCQLSRAGASTVHWPSAWVLMYACGADPKIGYITWGCRLGHHDLLSSFVLPCITLGIAFVNQSLAELAHVHVRQDI